MYRDQHYTRSSAAPPPPRSSYDRRDLSHSSYPPPPRQWDDRRPADDRDGHYRQDRNDNYASRGPYSDLRQPSTNGNYRDFRDDARPPQGEFTFRSERPAGISNSSNSYQPSYRDGRGPERYGSYYHDRRDQQTHDRDRYDDREHNYRPRYQENDRSSGRGGNRGRGARGAQRRGGPPRYGQPRKAADRLLLSKKHDEGELMLGDTARRATYRDVDELSDSDEAAMDISDNSDSNEAEPANKRARTSGPTADGDADQDVPKWSNPDPYTALPPPADSTRKKKDMVHLIRKSRVEAAAEKISGTEEAADFISCDLSDDEDVGEPAVKRQFNAGGKGLPNAPTGPRAAPSSLPPKPPPPQQSGFPRDAVPLPPPPPPPPPPEQPKPEQARAPQPTKQDSRKNRVDLTASTSLGNRKRTFDDQIKLPHASLKRVTKMAAAGDVVPVWQPEKGQDPCPWATTDHSATACMGTRLHKEIMDFYEYVRPQDFEERVRHEMIVKLRALIKQKWRDADLYPFGSFMSGLYLPCADMDVAICSQSLVNRGIPKYDRKKDLWALKSYFQQHRIAFRGEIELILGAKVPLVKYTDNQTALKVDISFEKMDGHKAIQTFLDWKDKYPAMPILVSIIKHFLLMRGLNEPVNGGLGGFSVICMVVNLLNQMPQIQSGSMKPEHHLGEVLMEFFDYYGNHFQYKTVAIRMNPPGLVNKSQVSDIVYRNMDRMSILDPNNSQNDISGGSSNTATILRRFSRAASILRGQMSDLAKASKSLGTSKSNDTLLGPLFAGNYTNFRLQRDYLRHLSETGLPDYGLKGTAYDHVQW